jgi:hypothetical protein
MEEILEAVFSVRSVQRLHNEERSDLTTGGLPPNSSS